MPITLKSAAATFAFEAATPGSLRSSSARIPHTNEIGAWKRFCSSTAACTPLTTSWPYFCSGPESVTLTAIVSCCRNCPCGPWIGWTGTTCAPAVAPLAAAAPAAAMKARRFIRIPRPS